MNSRQMAMSAALTVGMAAAPLSAAQPEPASPLALPFIGVGAILGTAGLIVTAPFRAVCSGCYRDPYPSLAGFDAYLPYYTAPAPTTYHEPPIGYSAPAYPPASSVPIIQPPIGYPMPTYPPVSSAPIIQPPISYSTSPRAGYPPYGAR